MVPQKFGPSPDADNVVAKYRGKLDESGYDINPNMGEAGEGGAVPGRVYWDWKLDGEGGKVSMRAWIYKFDELGIMKRDENGNPDVDFLIDKRKMSSGKIF